MATYSNSLAKKIPWTEEPGRLQSMGLQKVGHDLATEHARRHVDKYKIGRFLDKNKWNNNNPMARKAVWTNLCLYKLLFKTIISVGFLLLVIADNESCYKSAYWIAYLLIRDFFPFFQVQCRRLSWRDTPRATPWSVWAPSFPLRACCFPVTKIVPDSL